MAYASGWKPGMEFTGENARIASQFGYESTPTSRNYDPGMCPVKGISADHFVAACKRVLAR